MGVSRTERKDHLSDFQFQHLIRFPARRCNVRMNWPTAIAHGLRRSEFLALKHESRILRHSSDPVCGFSIMKQVRLWAVWPMENWLCSSLNHIQGWSTVRESYSRALEQVPLEEIGRQHQQLKHDDYQVSRERRFSSEIVPKQATGRAGKKTNFVGRKRVSTES